MVAVRLLDVLELRVVPRWIVEFDLVLGDDVVLGPLGEYLVKHPIDLGFGVLATASHGESCGEIGSLFVCQ